MDVMEHTSEVREIVGRPAPWLARNGYYVLIAIVTGLLLLAASYRYPSTLQGELVLSTVDPPRPLTAQTDMTVDRLLVSQRDTVAAGQTLVVAAGARARFEHVLALEDQLLEYRAAGAEQLLDLELSPALLLGPIQEAVGTFEQTQEVYRNVINRRLEGYTTQELTAMISQAENRLRELRNRRSQLDARLDRAIASVAREEELQREGLRNEDRLKDSREAELTARQAIQQLLGTVRQQSLSIELMRNQIAAYRDGRQGSSQQAATELTEAFDALQASVIAWKQEFTVVSPVNGTVVLQGDVREGGYLRRDQLVATVLPADAGGTVGRLRLPVAGSGRLAEGQEVIVRFDRWPVLEYGTVTGRVAGIGIVPVDEHIDVEVRFPQGLQTSFGSRLEGSPLMHGTADIVVDRRRLLQRLLGTDG